MKYSDIIELHKDFIPVIDLKAETSDHWETFIPTKQFETLLALTLETVSSSQLMHRKGIWVQGTFGTGKSHASLVIKHLLSDKSSEIERYANRIKNADVRSKLLSFRSKKRLFPVVLKGVESVYNLRTFSLVLERRIKESLAAAGHKGLKVKSDFENAIDIIQNKAPYVQDLIDSTPELRIIAKTKEDIIKKLRASDNELYMALEDALSTKYSVQLSSGDITKWLSDIEAEIRKENIADGILVIWDEFTSVVDIIDSGLINVLQNIAELSKQHNIYLYLVSHRNRKGGDTGVDISLMQDRFHPVFQYRMESLTTYHIMAASLKRIDESKYIACRDNRMNGVKTLITQLTDDNSPELIKNIADLFPMHPYAAFLCSMLSNQIGSTNRSVFEFLYDERQGFKKFLQTEISDSKAPLLTADCFWDFFLDKFVEDPTKYGFVTEVYARCKDNVIQQGEEYEKVFKGILLFNAMRGLYGSNDVHKANPSEENIRNMFASEPFENSIDDILDYFDKKHIVTRDPNGSFPINATILPPEDINDAKRHAEETYKDVLKILDFDPGYKSLISSMFTEKEMTRKTELCFLSCSADEFLIKSRLNKDFKEKYTLHIALFFAMNDQERASILDRLKHLSQNDFPNVIFVVFSEIFDSDAIRKQRFIDYVARFQVSQRYRSEEQANYQNNADLVVKQWINKLKLQGNYQLFFRGDNHTGIATGLTDYINKSIGYKIFNSGAEALLFFRNPRESFFGKSSPKVAEVMLCATDRDDAESRLKKNTQIIHAKELFKSNDDYVVLPNLTLKTENAPDYHPLIQVQRKVDEIFARIQKQNNPVFHIGRELSPLNDVPFGLYKNIPSIALLSYALRKYQNNLFKTDVGEVINPDVMRDTIIELLDFWDSRNNGSKLNLRFGSKEEKELKDLLIEIFNLTKLLGASELTSIKGVKFGIQDYCTKKAKYPLWSLKFTSNTRPELNKLIDGIVDVIQKQDPDKDVVKNLLRILKHNRTDFQLLLAHINVFEDGFAEFVNQIEDVKIEPSWWGELHGYLSEKMQQEIWLWKEDDVKAKIYGFYIQKIKPVDTPPPFRPVVDSTKGNIPNPESISQGELTKIEMVKTKIKSANLPTPALKYVLLKVLDEYPITADVINQNIG